MKYDILAISFPATRSDFVFVAGADQNVRCSLVNSRVRKAALSSTKAFQHGTRSAFWPQSVYFLNAQAAKGTTATVKPVLQDSDVSQASTSMAVSNPVPVKT